MDVALKTPVAEGRQGADFQGRPDVLDHILSRTGGRLPGKIPPSVDPIRPLLGIDV